MKNKTESINSNDRIVIEAGEEYKYRSVTVHITRLYSYINPFENKAVTKVDCEVKNSSGNIIGYDTYDVEKLLRQLSDILTESKDYDYASYPENPNILNLIDWYMDQGMSEDDASICASSDLGIPTDSDD